MMKLTPNQKLFLHNVLFHYLASNELGGGVRSNVEEIMEVLEDDLLYSRKDSEDEEADVSEDEEVPTGDDRVSMFDVKSLPPCKVKVDGDSGDLSFFGNDSSLHFDVVTPDEVLADGDDVMQITRGGKEITLVTSDGDTKTFQVSKFPKEWTSLLKANLTYDVV